MSFASRPNWLTALVSLADLASAFGDVVLSPASAVVDVGLNTDGTAQYDSFGSPVNFNWHAPTTTGIGSSYWCRMTVNSGTALTGSATGSILALSSNRNWTLTRSGVGVNTTNATLEIFSDAAGANLVASRTITMTATVDL